MTKISEIIMEKVGISEEKLKEIAPKTSIGRELINNLMYRLSRRDNVLVEMDNHYVSKIRIPISSNFFNKGEKNLHLWVKPIPERAKNNRTYLMLKVLDPSPSMFVGTKIRASDIFGKGINNVRLS